MTTTVTTTENVVTVTDSGAGTAIVTVSSTPTTVSVASAPAAHASTHGPSGVDPITALGNLTIGTATMTGGTATNLALVTPTVGTATLTGGTATSLTLGAATFSNAASFGSGSAGTPSVTFTGDTNTGIYSPGADQVGIATAGTARVTVDASGNVGMVSPSLDIRNDGIVANYIRQATTDANGPNLNFDKYRGTYASPTIVSSADQIGTIWFRAYDGSALRNAAAIRASVDGGPAGSDMPGRFEFYTTADGSSSLTERLRIDNAGLITGTGTSLGAWTSYTPTLGGTGWAIGNGTINGEYCRIGKVVAFRIHVSFGSTSTFGSGVVTVTAPLASVNSSLTTANFVTGLYDASATTLYTGVSRMDINSTTIRCRAITSASGAIGAITSTVPFTWNGTDGDQLYLNGVYETSA